MPIEHGLLYNQEQRLWYVGPMFRHERRRKVATASSIRTGAEVFGLQGPDIDAELIMLTARWWRELGIADHVSLEPNSIGSLEACQLPRRAGSLPESSFTDKLDEDSKRRMYTNPLRVLDSKNPDVQALLNDAPALGDYLDEESKPTLPACARCLTMPGSATPSTSVWYAASTTITVPCSSG